jgi:hypothetical protein
MDVIEKAHIRIEHWLEHNESHIREYEAFARELEDADENESARQIREMAALAAKSSDCLRRALKALD